MQTSKLKSPLGMTAVLRDREQGGTAMRAPRLLYVDEFPPSNHHGGAILLKRLLDKHPADRLLVITSDAGMKASEATELFECRHIVLPVFGGSRYRWLGRLMRAANWLALPFVTLIAILEVRRKRVEAVITIAQGRYYFAAAFAAWVTATPHITIVHDSFVSASASPSNVLRTMRRFLARMTLRNAAYIYVVSPEMQRLVRRECGRESEIQMPSTAVPARQAEGPRQITSEDGPVILYAGTITYTVRDCLDLLADLIATGQLKEYGMSGAKLHLCAPMTDTEIRTSGWDRMDIVCRGWVPQSELPGVLSGADILFLPYSFLESSREAVETAFPSKTADYLAAGKPVLVFGPKYSSLVRYASEQGFAEIVDEFSAAALARGIQKIAFSPPYRKELAARALEVFSANHDIRRQQDNFYLTLERIIRVYPGRTVPSIP
jgi:glycosyltransferase involved in cell wall biosynthesis